MRDQDNNIVWNLGLKKIGERKYSLIMPDEDGILLYTDNQLLSMGCEKTLSWPVNPHFTGKSAIIVMLQSVDGFKDVEFI